MAKAKRGLGKGLGAFFGEEVVQEVAKDQENEKKEITSDKEEKASVEEKETENENGEFFVKISRIEPNREQPRKEFGEPMKRKSVLLLTSVVLSAMLLGGCGGKEESTSVLDDIQEETVEAEEPEVVEEETEAETEEEEESREGMYRSELTNEWIDESLKNQRPIAAMVDNEKTALPHFGLSDADVVYEMMNSTKNGFNYRFF